MRRTLQTTVAENWYGHPHSTSHLIGHKRMQAREPPVHSRALLNLPQQHTVGNSESLESPRRPEAAPVVVPGSPQ